MPNIPILAQSDMSLFQLRTRNVRNFLTFAGKNSKDFLLYISGPGVYDAPAVDSTLQTISGKNGDLVMDNAKAGEHRFKNLDITYDAFFFDALAPRTASVKSWLFSPVGYQVLHDTYDPDFFRMAICKDALSFEPKRGKGASMKLVFHCQPQRWSIDGQRRIRMEESGIMKNPFSFRSKPIIRVYGSGAGKVHVRDVEISILQNEGYIDLDCETHNASNQNGFCNQYVKSGDFPELEPGRNAISWEGAITALEIMPRWWTL